MGPAPRTNGSCPPSSRYSAAHPVQLERMHEAILEIVFRDYRGWPPALRQPNRHHLRLQIGSESQGYGKVRSSTGAQPTAPRDNALAPFDRLDLGADLAQPLRSPAFELIERRAGATVRIAAGDRRRRDHQRSRPRFDPRSRNAPRHAAYRTAFDLDHNGCRRRRPAHPFATSIRAKILHFGARARAFSIEVWPRAVTGRHQDILGRGRNRRRIEPQARGRAAGPHALRT